MGPRVSFGRLIGFALLSVVVVASAQPLMAQATESEGYVVAASAEQVIGTWVAQVGVAAIRFDEDGTYREAWGLAMLDAAPFAISTYRFDGAVMLVGGDDGGTVVGVPDCGDVVGRYEARLLASGSLQFVPIEDACDPRRNHMQSGVYDLVEGIVTSPDQVIGTWRAGMGYVRFDEDGTFRSARTAETLVADPNVVSSYRFEGQAMVVTELAVRGVPACGEVDGWYEVRRLEGGNLRVNVIQDACLDRAGEMRGVYLRGE